MTDSPIAVGQPAPDFLLPASTGKTPLSLAEGTNARGLLERVTPHKSTGELLRKLGAGTGPVSTPVGKCIEGRFGLEYATVMPGDKEGEKDYVKGGAE